MLVFSLIIVIQRFLFWESVNLVFLVWVVIWRARDVSLRHEWLSLAFWVTDSTTYWMLGISLISMFLARIAVNLGVRVKSINLKFLVRAVTLRVILFFYRKTFLFMYIIFEISVIPIFLIILGAGYQPERRSASWALFLYTVSCSLPLLATIIFIIRCFGTRNFSFIQSFILTQVKRFNFLICATLFLAFSVKLPTFLFHMWLPKAHVEAPGYGSIILASVLLKLGGAGLVRLLFLVQSKIYYFLIYLSARGLVVISLICCYVFDLKMIVAYSSVAHIALVLIRVLSSRNLGWLTGLLIIISHAFISSSLFLGVTLIYLNSNSRRALLNKGFLSVSPKIAVVWSLCCIGSIATPPLMRFFGEVLSFFIIVNSLRVSIILRVVTILAAGAYSLILYRSVSHGENIKLFKAQIRSTELCSSVLAIHTFFFILGLFILRHYII